MLEPTVTIDGKPFDVHLSRRARRAGISDDHIRAAHRAGIDVFLYHATRRTGASDRRVRSVQRAGINLREYVLARWAGATDQQIRAAHRTGGDFYLSGSSQGTSQLQALLVLDGWLSRHMRPPTEPDAPLSISVPARG